MDAHNLHFFIDHHAEKHGWIGCYLTFDDLTHRFWASGAVPPFHDLLDFLRSITLNRLPAWFSWDEEGPGPLFEAWPLDGQTEGDCEGNGLDFHLRIIYEGFDVHWTGSEEDDFETRQMLTDSYKVLLVDADLNREAVVDAFFPALRHFILYRQQSYHWHITLSDLMSFEQLRARHIPPRSDITHAEPVDLRLERWVEEEERIAGQHLEFRMWDMMLGFWRLDDTDPFWPQWFALLEHALNRQPYELSFIDISTQRNHRALVLDGSCSPDEVGPDYSTRMVAIPLDCQLPYFRLQIFQTDYCYTDFLRVDEVIDSVQLTRLFLDSFEDILNDGYKPYPDEDGQVFDLRELPVGRLKEILSRIQN